MRKLTNFIDLHADNIILTFIKLAGYFCLFFSGFYFDQMLSFGFDAWTVATGIGAVIAFILSRIFVNVLERMRNG